MFDQEYSSFYFTHEYTFVVFDFVEMSGFDG